MRTTASKENEEAAADWMILVGACVLLGSLFLTWSHQITPRLAHLFAGTPALVGIPANPDAWQVYSAIDVAFVLLAVALASCALFGSHAARLGVFALTLVAVAFCAHAVIVPPTNGVLLTRPGAPVDAPYVHVGAMAGPGESVALVGLGLALAGLAASFLSDAATSRGTIATTAAA